jgi:PilZ domain
MVEGSGAAPAGSDRRRHERHVFSLSTTHLQAEVDGFEGRLRVRDISLGGVNLVLSGRFPPGSVITVRFRVAGMEQAIEREARVIYLMPQANGYTLGAAFLNELTDEELRSLF